MQRAQWLEKMRRMTEALYDRGSPQYWVTWGFTEDEAHRAYLQKFLERVAQATGGKPGLILSAACGAGRYDGLLLEAGHSIVGTDISAGMLARAREHFPADRFPQLRYEKIRLQDIDFHETFDGAICMDAMENICPEDYPPILGRLQDALKPGGVLYFTADTNATAVEDQVDLAAAYERAKARGMPVVWGEWVDEIEESYAQAMALEGPLPDELSDRAVYHYFPPIEQVRAWIHQAGLAIEEEGHGSGWQHFLTRKSSLYPPTDTPTTRGA